MARTVFAALALFTLAGLPAVAAPMPASIFRHVAANGTTKPDGVALDRRAGTTPDLDRKSHDLHDLIATAICRGC